jgi:hypothetical protein
MVAPPALPLHIRGTFPDSRYGSDEARLARRGKITQVLLDTSGHATLAWFNIRAIRFDISRTRPRTWLCDSGCCGSKNQGKAKWQN